MAEEEHGPFDEILQPEAPYARDRTALIVVGLSIALGVLLLILVLPPISILDSGGGGGAELPDNIATTIRDDMPAPPAGFEAVSSLFDLSVAAPVSQKAKLTVNLSSTVAADEELSLFTYQGDEWERLGDAEVVANGTAASGEVSFFPTNVAAFRQASTVRTVTGYLQPGGEIDPRSQGLLSTLNPLGLTPAADGQLSGGPLQVPSDLAIDVVPVIAALTPDAITNINSVLTSPDLRTAHTQAIAALARDGNYAGIELVYRFDPGLQAEFSTFAQELSTALGQDGKTLTLTIPAPAQEGGEWNTQGFDLTALSPLVTVFKIAADPDQDTYYQRLDAALGFLTSRVGASKLLLTIDSFSRERSVDGVRTMPLTEALGLAAQPVIDSAALTPNATVPLVAQNISAAGIHWDEAARAVTFTYTGGGGDRTVWLADLFSEAFRLDLASRYQLRGVAVEDVSLATEASNIWPVVAQYAQSGEVQLVTPNGTLLQPAWSASAGTLSSEQGAQVSWQAPADPGTYTVTLIVSDGIVRVGQELSVPVVAP